MPHLLFRGVDANLLSTVAPSLAAELAALCECGTDNFTINALHTTAVFGEPEAAASFAFIEVGWFERGREIRNAFAGIVTQYMLKLGFAEVEVVFQAYREDSYYINGEPCQS
jgi:hypothetical protein